MTLSVNQQAALRNLAAKHAGQGVGWINIADALALTGLGLAKRTRAGWEITAKGAGLVDVAVVRTMSAAVLPFRRLA